MTAIKRNLMGLFFVVIAFSLTSEGRGYENAPANSIIPEDLVIEDVYQPGFGKAVGRIQLAQGQVVIIHTDKTRGYWAKKDLPLYKGDTLITEPRGRLRFMLNDESILTLGSRTKMVINRSVYDPKKKSRSSFLGMDTGKARFWVTKTIGFKRSEFKVKTKTAVAGVRGSDFKVEVKEVPIEQASETGPVTGSSNISQILTSGEFDNVKQALTNWLSPKKLLKKIGFPGIYPVAVQVPGDMGTLDPTEGSVGDTPPDTDTVVDEVTKTVTIVTAFEDTELEVTSAAQPEEVPLVLTDLQQTTVPEGELYTDPIDLTPEQAEEEKQDVEMETEEAEPEAEAVVGEKKAEEEEEGAEEEEAEEEETEEEAEEEEAAEEEETEEEAEEEEAEEEQAEGAEEDDGTTDEEKSDTSVDDDDDGTQAGTTGTQTGVTGTQTDLSDPQTRPDDYEPPPDDQTPQSDDQAPPSDDQTLPPDDRGDQILIPEEDLTPPEELQETPILVESLTPEIIEPTEVVEPEETAEIIAEQQSEEEKKETIEKLPDFPGTPD